MKKFVELLNKYKREIISGVVIVSIPICIGLIGKAYIDKEINEVNKREEQQIVEQENPEITEPEIIPEEEQEPETVPPVENNISDTKMARSLIEPSIQESIGDLEYTILEEDNQLILVMHIPAEELAYVSESTWNELANNAIYAQTSWQDVFDSYGLNVVFSVAVGDINRDRIYLAISDGQIIYDVFEEQDNNLESKSL